jgi:hypothetical protein
MPQIRTLLKHVTVETAMRTRLCSRHRSGKGQHQIQSGERCLVVKDASGAGRNYCFESALEILKRAEDELGELKVALGQ